MTDNNGQPQSNQHTTQGAPTQGRLAALENMCTTARQRPLEPGEIDQLNTMITASANYENLLGARYLAVEPHKLVLRLETTKDHRQPWGVTNGGVYASLAETAGSMASYIAAGAGNIVMGTSNYTNFLRPSTPGDVIISTATPEHLGRTSHMWRIEHTNQETGKTLAISTLKTAVMPAP